MINYTFIIPHHNDPENLERCIKSIPIRDDIEIIVVDDNSKPENIPKLKQKYLKIITIPSYLSKGAGKARNIGLSLAKGKWILFADSDDFYEKDFIFYLDQFINSKFDIIYFDIFYSYNIKNKKEVWHNQYSHYIRLYNKKPTSKYIIAKIKFLLYVPWNFMVKNEYIRRINAYFEEIPKGNDCLFKITIGKHTNNITVIDKKIYYWIYNKNSTTHKKFQKEEIINIAYHTCTINRLKDEAGGWCTIAPLHKGIWGNLKKYGIRITLKIILIKIRNDIPMYKRIWYYIKEVYYKVLKL